jgi:general secretion pathway protein H
VKRISASGFTLIEILVVIFIISIVTSVALLTISRNENKKIDAFAIELAQLITLAEEQAMLQPQVLGLLVDDQTLQFKSMHQSGDKISWTVLEDKLLGTREVPDDIALTLRLTAEKPKEADDEKTDDDETVKQIPQIIISTNGDLTPFSLYIGKRGQNPRYLITGDEDGHLTSQPLS